MPNLLLDAGPGSGKTKSLVEGYKWTLTRQLGGFVPTQEQIDFFFELAHTYGKVPPEKVCFIAFNKEVEKKLNDMSLPGGCRAWTFNGLGASCIIKKWKHQRLDKLRGQKLLQECIGRDFKHLGAAEKRRYLLLLKYIENMKEELLPVTFDSLEFVRKKYSLQQLPEDPEANLLLIERLMGKMSIPNGEVEYKDQIWLALRALPEPRFDLAFVDEAQDLSTLRLEFALKVAKNVVFCGDPYQSINAFAGADFGAFEKLRQVCYKTMPLKTCFRCPPNHIDHFNTIRPARIKAFKTNPGPIETLELHELPIRVKLFQDSARQFVDDHEPLPQEIPPHFPVIEAANFENYMILSRTNAKLLRAGLQLLRHDVPTKIVKREDDSVSLVQMLNDFFDEVKQPTTEATMVHLDALMNKANAMPYNQGIALYDKCECLKVIIKDCKKQQLVPAILEKLDRSVNGAIRLCTIHKAKGLEAHFIFILFPPIRHEKATTPDQIEQEINLEFVAESRSQYYKAYIDN